MEHRGGPEKRKRDAQPAAEAAEHRSGVQLHLPQAVADRVGCDMEVGFGVYFTSHLSWAPGAILGM